MNDCETNTKTSQVEQLFAEQLDIISRLEDTIDRLDKKTEPIRFPTPAVISPPQEQLDGSPIVRLIAVRNSTLDRYNNRLCELMNEFQI